MRKLLDCLVAAFIALAPAICAAAEPPLDPNDPRAEDRKALRELLARTEQAFNKLDVEAVLGVLDKDAVVVWQDGHRTRSHAEVREHYKRIFAGPGALVKSVQISAAIGAPARFYGADHAIAYGDTKEKYEMVGGGLVALDGLWSTHLVKRDGVWRADSLHFSTNPFGNQALEKLQQLAWIAGAVGAVAGLIIGWFLGSRRRRA